MPHPIATVDTSTEKPLTPTAASLGLIPAQFPAHPRVFCTEEDLKRVSQWVHEVDWVSDRVNKLREAAVRPFELPDQIGQGPDARGVIQKAWGRLKEMALCAAIDSNVALLGRARELTVKLARAYLALPIVGIDKKVAGGSLGESHTAVSAAQLYDLLEPDAMLPDDRFVLRAMLREMLEVLNRSPHRTCGNHNTWTLTGKLAIGSALGDADVIRSVFEGSPAPTIPDSPDTPSFRYGLIHQIGHDYLSDGFHWERTCGYHMYTLLAMSESAYVMGNLGINLWQKQVPVVLESQGYDLHRSYGPAGTRNLLGTLHAILHCAMASGRLPFLHDTHTGDLTSLNVWGPLLARVYDATQDPQVGWALKTISGEGAYVPPGVLHDNYTLEFPRVRHRTLGKIQCPWASDGGFAQTGVSRAGHSVFPDAGHAVLRGARELGHHPSLFFYWGPHSAGHQSPAALHIDIDTPHRRGTMLADTKGYGDPNHLTWFRATVAQNTVTVDEQPMFPYDVPTNSMWEADSWRRRTSEGKLELFQTENTFSAIRATNQLVYPGVKLDRTLVFTHNWVLDVYRVFSDTEHLYDWSMHLVGTPSFAGQAEPISLGDKMGYRHLENARVLPASTERVITWTDLHTPLHAHIVTGSQDCRHILADKKVESHDKKDGTKVHDDIRSVLLSRTRAAKALFLSVWSWSGKPVRIASHSVVSDRLTVDIDEAGQHSRWQVPVQSAAVTRV
jgi:hypothetical protein